MRAAASTSSSAKRGATTASAAPYAARSPFKPRDLGRWQLPRARLTYSRRRLQLCGGAPRRQAAYCERVVVDGQATSQGQELQLIPVVCDTIQSKACNSMPSIMIWLSAVLRRL